MGPQDLQLLPVPDPLPELPHELAPSHHSYYSSVSRAQLNYTIKYLGASSFNLTTLQNTSHRYSDGRCALLQWAQFADDRIAQRGPSGFQLHFIEQCV